MLKKTCEEKGFRLFENQRRTKVTALRGSVGKRVVVAQYLLSDPALKELQRSCKRFYASLNPCTCDRRWIGVKRAD